MNMTLATINAVRRANNFIAQKARIGMHSAQGRESYLLHFFRFQEAKTLLTILQFYKRDEHTLETIARRTRELLTNPEYCGDNHHKHYLQAIKKIQNDQSSIA